MDLVRRLLAEPDLDQQEERRLAVLARSGDVDARDALLRASLRLVALRVRALGFGPRDVDDAFQVGVVALMAAVARYDPARGIRLATYAWPWITRALQAHRAHRHDVPHDRLPEPPRARSVGASSPVLDALAVLDARERDVLVARFSPTPEGRCPTPWAEVADRLGLGTSTARRIGEQALSRARREVGRVCDRAPLAGADPP